MTFPVRPFNAARLLPMTLHGRALVTAMCIGQVGNLLPHVVVPAIMAQHLMPLWHLSAAQAGLMASAYAFGYMLAVPVLAALTDRIDARRILLAGSALSGLATVAFGLFADGLWSAIAHLGARRHRLCRRLHAGPQSADRPPAAGRPSRSVTLYTSSFSLGVGLSFLVAQLVADALGWRTASSSPALGPLAMIAACLGMAPFSRSRRRGHPLDFRPVFRNRAGARLHPRLRRALFRALWLRTWIVAFWTFVAARNAGDVLLGPIAISVLVTVLSLPASILGNEAAIRFGRHRAITAVMFASAAVALVIGFIAAPRRCSCWRCSCSTPSPCRPTSGALTSGMSAERRPGESRRHHGTAFDGRLRLSALGRLGRSALRSTRRAAGEQHRMARGVFGARGRRPAWTGGALVVAATRSKLSSLVALAGAPAGSNSSTGLPDGPPGGPAGRRGRSTTSIAEASSLRLQCLRLSPRGQSTSIWNRFQPPGSGARAVGHRLRGATRAVDRVQQQAQLAARQRRKAGRRMHIELEAQRFRVKSDGRVDVVDDVSNADGHGAAPDARCQCCLWCCGC